MHHIRYFQIGSSNYFQPLKAILPKSPHIAFSKNLRDKFVRSKLRPDYEEEKGAFICGRSNCGIFKAGE